MEDELDAALKTIKGRITASLNKIAPEVWQTRKFDNILQLCNAVYKQNTIEKKMKGHITKN